MMRATAPSSAAPVRSTRRSRRSAEANSSRKTAIAMDTLVTIEVLGAGAPGAEQAIDRALGWFREIEARCTRFDPGSELRLLCAQPGRPIAVSPLLFRVVEFAVSVAEATGGAFDPTVGALLARTGFDRNYATGVREPCPAESTRSVTYKAVILDGERQTIELGEPLVLDLGAIAKGFAIDLAMAELSEFESAAVEAGGDLRVRGLNAEGRSWRVGIRHPRHAGTLAEVVALSDAAICTSADDERVTADGHHIFEPQGRRSARGVASSTVIAPTAMAADAFATAAFVLGPVAGIAFLEKQGVEGMLVTPALERFATKRFARFTR